MAKHHRHHKPLHRAKVTLAVASVATGSIVGVAALSRPVSRHLDDGETLEVSRLATDGTPNACSFLLARCRAVASKMGASRLVTYTLPEEGGASLRRAGFDFGGEAGGGSWSRAGRLRRDNSPVSMKHRWEVAL